MSKRPRDGLIRGVINIRRDGLIHRALTGPILAHTHDRTRAENSRFTWGLCPDASADHPCCYRLRPLGVLHGLTGLAIRADKTEGPLELLDRISDRMIRPLLRRLR